MKLNGMVIKNAESTEKAQRSLINGVLNIDSFRYNRIFSNYGVALVGKPLRLEFSGALYHVTSRGDRRKDIYESDDDRNLFLEGLSEVCKSYNRLSS